MATRVILTLKTIGKYFEMTQNFHWDAQHHWDTTFTGHKNFTETQQQWVLCSLLVFTVSTLRVFPKKGSSDISMKTTVIL